MNLIKNIIFHFVLCCFLIAGCSSTFKTAHQKFIDAMDLEISLKRTLNKMDYNPAYPRGYFTADYHNLKSKEVRADGFLIYHYARAMLTGEYICHYHLVVDPKTDIVIDWGFDTEFGDPKKTCGIAG